MHKKGKAEYFPARPKLLEKEHHPRSWWDLIDAKVPGSDVGPASPRYSRVIEDTYGFIARKRGRRGGTNRIHTILRDIQITQYVENIHCIY